MPGVNGSLLLDDFNRTGNDSEALNLENVIPRGFHIAHLCFESLLFFPTFIGNLLVIIAYFRFYAIKDEVSNIFILSLAITDIAVACMLPMTMVKKFISPLVGKYFLGDNLAVCSFSLIIHLWPSGATLSSLMVIALNRMLAIAYPLRYKAILTKKVSWCLVLFAHALPVVCLTIGWVISGVRGHEFKEGQLCVVETAVDPFVARICYGFAYYLPIALTYVMHSYAVVVAWKQKRKIAAEPLPANNQRQREYKILNTMSRILIAYTICFFPSAVVKTIVQPTPSSLWWKQVLNNVFLDLMNLNSALNPVIYAVSMESFRKAFKKLLCGTFQQNFNN